MSKHYFINFFLNYTYLLTVLFYLFFFIQKDTNLELITIFPFIILTFLFITNQFINYLDDLNAIIFIVFISLFLIMIVYNLLFLYAGETNIQFNPNDSQVYDLISKKIVSNNFVIDYKLLDNNFRQSLQYDDFGILYITAFTMLFYENNISLNILYVLLSTLNFYIIYKISCFYLNKRISIFVSSLSIITSYNLFFISSGLKEIILCTLVNLFYFFSINYSSKIYSVLSYLLIFLLIFFRPILIVISTVSNVKPNYKNIILFITFSVPAFLLLFIYTDTFRFFTYIYYIDDDLSRDRLIGKGSYSFLFTASFISSFLGPLPTISFDHKSLDSLYSNISLLSKFLFVPLYCLGIFTLFRKKLLVFFPLFFFILMNSLGLTFLLSGFELRYLVMHFPFYFIICGIALQFYKTTFIYYYFLITSPILTLFLILYNLR